MNRSFTVTELMILYYLNKKGKATYKQINDNLRLGDLRIFNSLDELQLLGLIKSNDKGENSRFELNQTNSSSNLKTNNSQEMLNEVISKEELIKFIKDKNNVVTREEVSNYFSLNRSSAYRILKKLTDSGEIKLIKEGKLSKYILI